AAVAGVLTWYFSSKLANAKDAAFNRFKEESKTAVAAANEKAAEANKAAAEANERAAILDKKAAEARLQLAKIDPLNLPIGSIRADVWLVVRADFFEWYFDNNPVLKGGAVAASVTLAGNEGALLVLHECPEFESMIWKEEGQPD